MCFMMYSGVFSWLVFANMPVWVDSFCKRQINGSFIFIDWSTSKIFKPAFHMVT